MSRKDSRETGKNRRKFIKMHRLVFELEYGKNLLNTESIDHIDMVKINNTISNLRLSPLGTSINQINVGLRSDNKTGYKGVIFRKKTNKYEAKISYKGKRIWLGAYEDIIEAGKAYNKKALELFGDGNERVAIQNYIKNNNLESFTFLRGNQTADFIKQKYQECHFLILPSKSEGWPKVVAEAMFWSCLPIATPVSCVVNMLDNENRGILLNEILIEDCEKIELLLHNETLYQEKVLQAVTWSQNYTTDYFEEEIKKLL
jgi:glycosyltransferase involved in cell wall biosynthesis